MVAGWIRVGVVPIPKDLRHAVGASAGCQGLGAEQVSLILDLTRGDTPPSKSIGLDRLVGLIAVDNAKFVAPRGWNLIENMLGAVYSAHG